MISLRNNDKISKNAGMVELADTQDLGSCGRPCRFKSCYPHQNRRGCSSSVECELPKLDRWVRLPSAAPHKQCKCTAFSFAYLPSLHTSKAFLMYFGSLLTAALYAQSAISNKISSLREKRQNFRAVFCVKRHGCCYF